MANQDAIRFEVGRTQVQMPFNPEVGRPEFKRVFHVLAYVEGQEHDPFIHFHAFDYKPDAEDLRDKVEEAGPSRAHLEASEHWDQDGVPAPKDHLTLEEKWAAEYERECREGR